MDSDTTAGTDASCITHGIADVPYACTPWTYVAILRSRAYAANGSAQNMRSLVGAVTTKRARYSPRFTFTLVE